MKNIKDDCCPLCNSSNIVDKEYFSLNVKSCLHCSHQFKSNKCDVNSYSEKRGRNCKNDDYEQVIAQRYEFIKEFIHEGDYFLDVGCAEGLLGAHILNRHIVEYDGLEPSKDNLRAQENLSRVHSCYIEDFSYKKTYNKIIMLHVLEHLENPLQALTFLSRLLSKNGNFIIEVPSGISGSKIIPIDFNEEHLHFFSIKTLCCLFESIGHEILKVETGAYLTPIYSDSIRIVTKPKVEMDQKVLRYEDILNSYLGNKFSIYGIGGDFYNLIYNYISPKRISFLFDMDVQKIGLTVMGKEVLHPSEITAYGEQVGNIVITSLDYFEEIKDYLVSELKIEPCRVFSLSHFFKAHMV